VRPVLVILASPLFDDNARFEQAPEDLPVKQFVAQLVVKTFDVGPVEKASLQEASTN
jgi:hypothetical protein